MSCCCISVECKRLRAIFSSVTYIALHTVILGFAIIQSYNIVMRTEPVSKISVTLLVQHFSRIGLTDIDVS